jgi:hypothetical protein
MTEKILYILGAGASAQELPLARSVWGTSDGLNPEIPGLAHALKTIDVENIFTDFQDENAKVSVAHIKDRFRSLSQKANEFGDVDTYAKYLHLTDSNNEELHILKRTLSEYFSICQNVLNKRDRRYLPWLVSIMDKKMFPKNVKILSWNYDFQVELAAAHFGSLEDINQSSNSFTYSPSLILHFPNLDPTFSDFSSLSLIHLNGIAGFSKNSQFSTGSVFQKKSNETKQKLLSFMENNNLHSNIHFAWEASNYHSTLMDHVKKTIDDTNIVVVIGYSFPFFNREIDKQIFNHLKSQNIIRKIYFQDPLLNGQQLKSQFELPDDFEIVHVQKVNDFHIPFEY